MKPILRFIVLVGACVFYFAPSASFSQETEKPPREKSEMLMARILVLDPDGYPLEGATVTPWALRPRLADAGHFGWNEDLHGPLPNIVTNAEGIAEVPVPKFVVEKLDLGEISWRVDHPEFVRKNTNRSFDVNPVEIKVERGFRIAVTAVDRETGEPIREDLFAVVINQAFADWKLAETGTLVSPVFPDDACVLRVMQLTDGRAALFSDLFEVNPGGRSRTRLKEVKLSKGVRVEGRLADDIPRPVRNGYVVANVDTFFGGRDLTRQWRWMDRAPIDEDGSFVFESLPPNGVLQMIPICDNWVPKLPSKDSVLRFYPDGAGQLDNNFFCLPQLIQLSEETATPILEMEPCTSVRLTVSDHDGNPVQNATVEMWPNQLWFNGGSQLLGASYPTREQLLLERRGESLKQLPTTYTSETDKDGVATIRNLPVRRSQSISIMHDQFELPVIDGRRAVNVELKTGLETEVKVQLQKKGTEVPGATKEGEAKDGKKNQGDSGGVGN